MNTKHYVKHSKIPREKLDEKSLAWCRGGTPFPYTLLAEEPRSEDGRYILRASHTHISPPSTKTAPPIQFFDTQPEGQFTQFSRESESLDQNTVDKIIVVEEGCILYQQRFDFAIIEDQQSSVLLKKN
jgi:hypothetical protein